MTDKYFPIYALIFVSTLIITALAEKRIIPFLKERAKQPIYAEGPKWHLKKSGTPTMGGIGFLLASLLTLISGSVVFLIERDTYNFWSLTLSLLFAIGNSFIGIIDDTTKLRKKENAGLTPIQKLALQFVLAALFLLSRRLILKSETVLAFSFGSIDIGFIYYPLAIFILLGLVNCANLTDGVDGLASSVAFAIGISLFYISASLSPSLSMISAAIIGASIGFLIFNLHPAKIFMGDTGSLFFGALIASSAFILENMLIMLFIAGVYVIEGVSVILQVSVYKLTRKRIFKMAPLHHHFERSGFTENKICLCAIFATFILSIPAYIFYLP